MKKIVLILGILFAMQTALVAQVNEDQEIVVFNAYLAETFNLNVDGVLQEITFANAADYNNGVTEGAGILPGTTVISVEATGTWNLSLNAPNFTPLAGGPNGPGTGAIPINNLGVYCTATGAHTFLTGEVTCAYQNAGAALGLSNPPAAPILIDNGTGNAGDISDNAFILHWVMGTLAPLMNPLTMFDQMAQTPAPFTPGDYTTTATLTLWSLP